MQAKIFLSLAVIGCYLIGLYTYADNRSASQELEAAFAAIEKSDLAHGVLPKAFDNIKLNAPAVSLETPAKVAKRVLPISDLTPVIVSTIQQFNRDLSSRGALELAVLIEETSGRYGVDPLLVTALVSQESAFYEDAVSPVGALGLGQLMPYTADDLGVDPYNPAENLEGCVRYLAQNLNTWSHTADPIGLALASYNAGPGAVEQYGGVPPYQETQDYVYIISNRYNQLLDSQFADTGTTKEVG